VDTNHFNRLVGCLVFSIVFQNCARCAFAASVNLHGINYIVIIINSTTGNIVPQEHKCKLMQHKSSPSKQLRTF